MASRAAVFVTLAIVAWAAAAAAADPAAIDRIVQAVIHDEGIQTRSPLSGEPVQAGAAATQPLMTLPEPVRAAARAAGYVLLAALLIGGVILLSSGAVAMVRRPGARGAAPALAPTGDPPPPAIDAPDADESERLAEAGDFSAAIHLLLLLAVDRLQGHGRAVLPRCLTSREVLGRARPPGEAGDALAGLVAAVEASHFGETAADEATWRRCRDGYRLIAAAAP